MEDRSMSGHSKWANIRVKKTAQDAVRGKIFTKHAKLIEIAAREGGGGDPLSNPRLATAAENARADNVPNANIERAIKKGTGELGGERTEEILYAAYGPGNVAMLIECLSDNRNRTLANIRSIIEKRGGRWAETGSVLYMFDHRGVVVAHKEQIASLSEEEELSLIDAGAEDLTLKEGSLSVVTDKIHWAKVRDLLKGRGWTIDSAGLTYVPKQEVVVSDLSAAKKLADILDAIDEDLDVSEVYTNANMSDDIVKQLS